MVVVVVVGEKRRRKFRIAGLEAVASVDAMVGIVIGNGDGDVAVSVVKGVDVNAGVETSSGYQRRPSPSYHARLYSDLSTPTHVWMWM